MLDLVCLVCGNSDLWSSKFFSKMGAYLSKPRTGVTSSVFSNDSISCGASAMQGWRVSMEDAHTCILDFDKNTSLFAVFDGHGGSEVALYAEKHIAEVLKATEGYINGSAKQGLTEAFLKLDEDIVTEEGLKELKEIAGENGDESGDENEADMLAKDAAIPLKELLEKLKGDIYKLEKDEIRDEESDEDKDDEMEEKEESAANGDAQDKETKVEGEEEKEINGKKNFKEKESKENGESGKDDNIKDKNCEDKNEAEKEEVDDDDEKDDAEQHSDEEDGSDEEEEEEDEDDDDENEDDDDETEGMVSTTDEVGYDSGTTAIVAMVKDDQLTVANAGDSRCVLCRNGIALEMSIDHKPEDAKELSRIQKAGGKVTGEGRVNGGLNLSRAIGDHSYKGRIELAAEEQQITAMPDVRQTQLTEDDEFMVIACDGIWNVMNSQEVVDFVKDEFKKQRKEGEVNLSKICEKLFKACLAPDTSGDGSGCDNMTCVIVTFDKLRGIKAGKRKSPEQTEITNPDKKSRMDSE